MAVFEYVNDDFRDLLVAWSKAHPPKLARHDGRDAADWQKDFRSVLALIAPRALQLHSGTNDRLVNDRDSLLFLALKSEFSSCFPKRNQDAPCRNAGRFSTDGGWSDSAFWASG